MVAFYVDPLLVLVVVTMLMVVGSAATWVMLGRSWRRLSRFAVLAVVWLAFVGAIIKSGATSDLWTIDPTSKAGRVTLYDTDGRSLAYQGKKTFAFTATAFTPAATPTDLCIIGGSASATIRVIGATFGGTATAAANFQILTVKRSSANTGGTFVAGTVVPLDSNDTSVAPTVGHYTANPTLGGTVGTVSRRWVGMPIAGTAGQFIGENLSPVADASRLDRPVTLRGTAQQLALNGNGAALPAGAANWFCGFIWMEE